jgi:xanthine/uracil permease
VLSTPCESKILFPRITNRKIIDIYISVIVLVSGIVAVLLNLLLPQEITEEEEEEDSVDVVDAEKQDHKNE